MDPDSGGYINTSTIFKTSLLTITFSAFYFYRTEKYSQPFKLTLEKKDSITVAEKKQAKPVKKKKKTIYLTFDDGPNKGTRSVMHIIEQEQVPVTLFVVGEHVYGSRYQSAIYDSVCQSRLFEIANHSYTHAFGNRFEKFYAVPDSAVKDFIRCADSLHLTTRIIRTPGRNIWRTDSTSCTDIKTSTAAADSLQQNGFKAVGWDLEWHFDDKQRLVQTTEEMINQVDSAFAKNKTKITDHLVLLAHDQVYANSQDSASLQQFINKLKEKDEYDFEQVSKYPGVSTD
ncbi:MAG: polysaccharide deacetylase family protein [Bacteroidetes bacterium]|nr:polysaccharide deacetylase family protein [Bacteroidota bacterium]